MIVLLKIMHNYILNNMSHIIHSRKTISQNRRASYDYTLLDRIEVGIVLKGSEVKSLRLGKVSIAESHVVEIQNELFLVGCHISPYSKSSQFEDIDSTRMRKLLLHRKQIKKLSGSIARKGFTIIPTFLYFNRKNIVKLEIAVAEGKKKHDKRQAIKEKEWKRRQSKEMQL